MFIDIMKNKKAVVKGNIIDVAERISAVKELHNSATDMAAGLEMIADTMDIRMTIRSLEKQRAVLKDQVDTLSKTIKVLNRQLKNYVSRHGE